MKRNSLVDKVLELVNSIPREKQTVIIAIDGRCASGKTTLCELLKNRLDCNVFHMDDFFLRPEQRTPQRLSTAGENVDHERFLQQVLMPLLTGESFSFKRYDCKTQTMKDTVIVTPKRINIVEGSYCCNKALRKYYDKTVFVSVDNKEQLTRILKRDGQEKAKEYQNKWIPLEERYFSEYRLENSCDLIL